MKWSIENVEDIRMAFVEKFKNNDFVIDKSGSKVIELIGVKFIADEESIFGKLNIEYANNEISWYLSQSLNVNDISNTPTIWKNISSKYNEVNSNYGWCVFNENNYNQYNYALNELINNPNSRRAVMMYNRPSMVYDYNKDGMDDYMCTYSTQELIRNNKLIHIVNQRSMDAVFGYKNDRYWAYYISKKLINDLKNNNKFKYLENEPEIIWLCGSLHLYERHFKFINDYEKNIRKIEAYI